MSSKAYPFEDYAAPFMKVRGRRMNWRRLARGAGRGWRKTRSFCCCCPVFLALGVAGLGAVGGLFYLGIRFLPLAL